MILTLKQKPTALFLYAGTLGNDGGYTKTGYPLKSIDGEWVNCDSFILFYKTLRAFLMFQVMRTRQLLTNYEFEAIPM